MTSKAFQLQVNRKDFHQFQLVEQDVPSEKDLSDGQILIHVDQFAFTANNITYAVVGEVVGYWNFFPVSETWGIIPVWGFGDVIASKNEAIKVGERYYGYYPMASHLVLSPTKVRTTDFTDGVSHRVELPAIYNNYIKTETDPAYQAEGEAIQSLFRPLFTTSFLIDDFLADQDFFDGKNIIITSASSKTAISLAFLLANRKDKHDINIIGLTSNRNEAFVGRLGYYNEVMTYGQVEKLASDEQTVIVDFSGNEQLQAALQDHLGSNLTYNCLVGMVDWAKRGGRGSASFNGKFFFAPSQAQKRIKEWGMSTFQEKLGFSWFAFTSKVDGWMIVEKTLGAKKLAELYIPMLDGQMDPKVGHIIELHSS